MTITQRILVQFALGAGLVISVATAVTYGMVYRGATERDLKHVETYVTERSRREETVFSNVEANLRLVRGQFLKRMSSPPPSDFEAKWQQRFRLFPDGAWRSREEFSDGKKFSTLWAHKNARPTPEWQVSILRAQDICDELLPGWVDTFPSLYFIFDGPVNIGFDPRAPAWVWDTPADYNVDAHEWYHLALPKDKPADRFYWTGVVEEPVMKVPIVSVYLPIDLKGRFIGSVGHDVYVMGLLQEVAKTEIPGAMHVIFRTDGRLIAHPTLSAGILASRGLLRMQDSGDASLASLYRTIQARTERRFSGFDKESGLYYSVARLAGPDWFFLTTMPQQQLRQQAYESARWVLWWGSVSLGLVLAFLATTLRRQIARPLAELTRATKQMSTGDGTARAVVARSDELGVLAGAFNEMAGRVSSRDGELRQLNQELEQRVARRTTELREANRNLEQAREEALGLLARERELNELKSEFVSLVSHEFRTPLEIIMSSVDNLQRYQERLPSEKREQLLRTINKAVRRMSGMMEEVLMLGRLETDRVAFNPTMIELGPFCQRVCEEIESATGKHCPIQLEVEADLPVARGDEPMLRHIFANLLSNAVKYSSPDQAVTFTVRREGETAVCRIADRGCGIPVADQKRLFEAFYRGSNVRQIPGTGLGLLIVRRCVDLHEGTIQFESAEGQGTTFIVRLPLFVEVLATADSL